LRYLNISELSAEKLGGRGRSSIYRDVLEGRLPAPVKFGGRIYWIEAEVDEAMKAAPRAQVGEAA
jgi:predicted DNA-binding transcriptional regulator AlpA